MKNFVWLALIFLLLATRGAHSTVDDEPEDPEDDDGDDEEAQDDKEKPDDAVEGACGTDKTEICKLGVNGFCSCAIYMDRTLKIECVNKTFNTLSLCISPEAKLSFSAIHLYIRQSKIGRLRKGKILPGHEKHVSRLDLFENNITEIEDKAFAEFNTLRYLNLNGNRIKKLTVDTFEGLENLYELSLKKNRLTDISGSVFDNLPELHHLFLDQNRLSKLDNDTFKSLNKLTHLSLVGCELDDVHEDWLLSLNKLETLLLENNNFKVLPSLHGLTNVRSIFLSGNPIGQLEGQHLSGLKKLQQLNLERMPELRFIDECAFCGLPKLEQLYLYKCPKLTLIHPKAFGGAKTQITKMSAFDVRECDLQILPAELLPWKNVGGLEMEDNPWVCDCAMKWFANASTQPDGLDDDMNPPLCKEPARHNGKQISSLKVEDFVCENEGSGMQGNNGMTRSSRARVILGVAVLVTFCAILFVLWYIYFGKNTVRALRRVVFLKRNGQKTDVLAYKNLAMNTDTDAEVTMDEAREGMRYSGVEETDDGIDNTPPVLPYANNRDTSKASPVFL